MMWLMLIIPVAIIVIKRPDLSRQMLFGALMALPVLAIQPLLFSQYHIASTSDIFVRVIASLAIGALAAGIYEALLHKHFVLPHKPSRRAMIYLFGGPIIFGLMKAFDHSFVLSLLVALTLDLVIVLVWRRDLVWDAAFSAIAMAGLYLILYLLAFRGLPGVATNFWFAELPSGVTILGLPVEEWLVIALFGALWGPIYVAIKDFRQN